MRLVVPLAVAGMTAWGAAAIHYAPLPGPGLSAALAFGLVVATVLAFLLLPRRRRTLLGFLVAFAVLVLLWRHIPASNDRGWQPEVAVAPWAAVEGDLVTIHGVRNLDYRTETDFVTRWEDRTYDLRKLDSADLVAAYWAGPAVAHVLVSFGFEGKDYVAVSIETRKERGEGYSTIAGFFRRYELVYVVADERDVIRVRTTYRQPREDVYVYRLRTRRENIRRAFLDYVRGMNELRARPRFYNTLTTNCTTGVLLHARVNPDAPPRSWKVLLTGYVPEYLYEIGRLDTSRPFPELTRLGHVNERAAAADRDPDFSQRIRDGIPAPPPLPELSGLGVLQEDASHLRDRVRVRLGGVAGPDDQLGGDPLDVRALVRDDAVGLAQRWARVPHGDDRVRGDAGVDGARGQRPDEAVAGAHVVDARRQPAVGERE
ncbi:MAG TPA: DUF4105 domain-containing protein [Thermodesulfobacteriota bacterium]